MKSRYSRHGILHCSSELPRVLLRYVIATPLLAAALLKALAVAEGDPVLQLSTGAAILESALAICLVVSRRHGRAVLVMIDLFLLTTIVYGLWRALGPAGFGGACGCLGKALLFKNWQQLLLSSTLLILTGILMMCCSKEDSRPFGSSAGHPRLDSSRESTRGRNKNIPNSIESG